jgi:hypothetical protein
MDTMGNLSRLLLLFGLLFSLPAVAQQYEEQNYPPADPYAQQPQVQIQVQADPYAAQPEYQQYEYAYMGAHPQPYDMGGGYCYQNTAHYHEYPPFDQYLFRESGGYWYFVGDPADFGYSMQMWGYNGNHPIPLAYGGGYCYINWGHRHPYSPPSSVYFSFVGGYYSYNGPWDPLYWRWRDRYHGYYGNYYRNNYYGGRYYTVRPPHVYRPSFSVGAPGVRVVAPPPGRTHHGGGGVVVGAPPPRSGVTVGPPARVYSPQPPARVYTPPPVHVAPPRVYAPPPARVYTPPPVHVSPPRVYSPPPPAVHRPAPAPVRVAPPPMRHR